MLCQMTIRNIALIEELTLQFEAGFSAMTGETGAGKSIVVDAMNLALGERADRELVRSGSEKAQVEALFDLSGNTRAHAMLVTLGIAIEDDQLVVSREVSLSGRNVVRINGSLQPVSILKQLTSLMVDLHGQHEHQSLLDETKHIGLLDAYAGESIKEHLLQVEKAYHGYTNAKKQLASSTGDARERAHRADMLSFQMREIEDAKLSHGEEEQCLQEQQYLRNQEKILSAIAQTHEKLSGGENDQGAADALRIAVASMQSIAAYDPSFATIVTRLEEASYILEDLVMEVAAFAESDEIDPKRIDQVERRLDTIRGLKRKYGADIESILQYAQEAAQEYDQLTQSEEQAKELEASIAKHLQKLLVASGKLSLARTNAAATYSKAVLAQLHDLGMSKAVFHIEVAPPAAGSLEANVSAGGYDVVRFLFSANAGEPAKPLAKIASGGEMSRVMLALKSVAADDISCLIFDEIDTGISGRMAQVVGEKIACLSQGRQIICVTHLPQIACMADRQYLVYKTDHSGRSETVVDRLDDKGRMEEIARLVGGADGELAAMEHAKGMLVAAKQRKESMYT